MYLKLLVFCCSLHLIYGKDCRNCPYWLPQLGGEYTPDAVQGGWNVEPLYVARIHVYGPYGFELLPGFFLPSRKSAFAGTQKNVYSNVHFALLVNCIAEWIEIDKDLPDDAIEGGQTFDGAKLYVCRLKHEGRLIIGRSDPRHKTCLIAYNGTEFEDTKYEILRCNNN